MSSEIRRAWEQAKFEIRKGDYGQTNAIQYCGYWVGFCVGHGRYFNEL
jgi:hypothetical protein